MNQFELGTKLRDTISGYEGIAISRIEFLNGCVQYALRVKVGKDQKLPEVEYFDSQQLEEVEKPRKPVIRKTWTGGDFSRENSRISDSPENLKI